MEPMRFLVNEVESANKLSGLLLSGELKKDDSVAIAPSGQQTSILAIQQESQHRQSASAETALSLELTYSVSIQPGDIIVAADIRPEFADQFEAKIDWLDEQDLLPGRTYSFRAVGGSGEATISKLKYRIEADSRQQIAATTLGAQQSGVGNIALTRPVVFDSFSICRATGQFELLDRTTGVPVARGEIRHGLRRASNVHWQALDVDRQSRASIKQQTPRIIWLTGLSGAGKSTIANLIEKKLLAKTRHSYLLDGDNVRHGLNKDLGFTDADRVENIRRVAETAKLMLDAGLIVITSFISPFRAERDMARTLFDEGEFIEVFIHASLEVCEQRDPKGLYKKARSGEIKNFTGLDSPYEPPAHPEMLIDTVDLTVEQAADEIIEYLENLPG
ncbi:MAG: adenylyl-sulfate kinase [Gammaproteobacteria bacterium]|jgi:bifunctional enzyme CysN/CysC|nr:adenylyl-sulfate kinase [Gammaproteobacteria bacterium]MDP6537139.1 adenylyl-sulfate kinase [Gammaproteobacteria bacterium]MDP6733112.1 adenylyl-sulfate kinase [Gammaproteobacteria bacterium]HAJ77275.1 adenylyl-sulfate kinase [Gammaproteobacteria bacterium]